MHGVARALESMSRGDMNIVNRLISFSNSSNLLFNCAAGGRCSAGAAVRWTGQEHRPVSDS
jgi:hypothetical protein